MNKELLIKSLLLIVMVMLASIILVRSFTSGQTLSDYARDNNIPHHSEEVESQ